MWQMLVHFRMRAGVHALSSQRTGKQSLREISHALQTKEKTFNAILGERVTRMDAYIIKLFFFLIYFSRIVISNFAKKDAMLQQSRKAWYDTLKLKKNFFF